MTAPKSYLKDMHILAVDDEVGILDTIEDVLDESRIDRATDYATASQKIKDTQYQLIILDIMGVDGLQLLTEAVNKGTPTVMLTAHALNHETLKESASKGALSYLPKDELVNLDEFLNELFETLEKGESPWKLLFDRLGSYFEKRFKRPVWDKHDEQFWAEAGRSYHYSCGGRGPIIRWP